MNRREYFLRTGIYKVNHFGTLHSVIGADKVRKGTPDTFTRLPNGRYIFAEYTAQQDHLSIKRSMMILISVLMR